MVRGEAQRVPIELRGFAQRYDELLWKRAEAEEGGGGCSWKRADPSDLVRLSAENTVEVLSLTAGA